MNVALTSAIEYAHNTQQAMLDAIDELVSIPSVSTDPDRMQDMKSAASWLEKYLRKAGMQQTKIFPTLGHPIVYGENISDPTKKPTVLIYGHYDVQPAEPLELWNNDPFRCTLKGDYLFGRGTSDMKGQIIATIQAVESILKTGAMPANIKFLLEGEEEIGSPSLSNFLEQNQELLACDVAINPDTGMISADTPTIVYSLRGLAYFELRTYGPEHDLHSGLFGGVIHNPAQALCEIISAMHDSDGRVTLPGFYDRVRMQTPEERHQLLNLPIDDTFFLERTGVKALWGEKGFVPVERTGTRPTLEVNGLLSGYTGKGSKTVIPSTAMAKISMRLVADQDPDEVHQQLIHFLESRIPSTIRWELIKMAGAPASVSDPVNPATQAMIAGLKAVWKKDPVYKPEGGSVPVVGDFQKILGVQSVLTGFGLPDDNIHAPDERLHLPTLFRGVDALIHFFFNYKKA